MIASWAKDEVCDVDFGDTRLDDRAGILLSALGSGPHLSIPAACKGRGEMKASYRFLNNKKVTIEKVLEPHFARTRDRMAGQKTVLLVQDTTEIDLTRPHTEVDGVGNLDRSRRGVLLHLMEAFTTDETPLGALSAKILNRTEDVPKASAARKDYQRKHTPIEEKESIRWVEGLQEARLVAQDLPGVECVCIADSEGDIYEVFAEPRGEHPVQLLIRGCYDRATSDEGGRLREQVSNSPLLYTVDLLIRGRTSKIATEKRGRRQSRETRRAVAEVRATKVTLRPPHRPDRKLPPVTVNVVMVRELHPPAGEPGVEWILITTLPIDMPEQVRTIVEYYGVRWQIEILFRVLKVGCRIEHRRFEHIDRVLPYLGLCLIVSWRTLFLCRMGRSCPDLDCEVIFEAAEWKAVWVATHGQPAPKKHPTLSQMVHLIASLGGYIERKESEPGVETLWIGMQRMYDLAWAWEAFGPGSKNRKD